jgi:hypothetical protein
MRLIATADFHGKQYRVNELIDAIEEFSPDLVVVCGDITHLGPGELAKTLLDQIPIETIAIPGNMDTAEVFEHIDKSRATNLHLKKVKKNGETFVGLGGSDTPLLPIDKQLVISEDEVGEKIGDLVEDRCVLVTHVPPHGVQDSVFLGMHAGSRWIREIVERYKPRLHLCGHIHEDPGFSKLGESVVINCSMGKHGRGALIDINERIEIEMLG